MEEPGREGDSPGPPWAPSESSAFRAFAAAVGERAEASPSGPGNGDSARSSNLRAVRKRPFVARLTTGIIQTFEKCNPEFKYSESLNPKRFLTNPAVPVHNDGLDNANSDLILYVNLELVNKKSSQRMTCPSCAKPRRLRIPLSHVQVSSYRCRSSLRTRVCVCEFVCVVV